MCTEQAVADLCWVWGSHSVKLSVMVFRFVMSCCLPAGYRRLGGTYLPTFDVGGDTFLRNIGNHQRHHTASEPRWPRTQSLLFAFRVALPFTVSLRFTGRPSNCHAYSFTRILSPYTCLVQIATAVWNHFLIPLNAARCGDTPQQIDGVDWTWQHSRAATMFKAGAIRRKSETHESNLLPF